MQFEYKAIDQSGKMIKNTVEAESRIKLIESLKEEKLTVIDLTEIAEAGQEEKAIGRVEFDFEMGVSEKRLLLFTRQFASMLHAGIPLLRCLDMLQQQSVSKALKKILKGISDNVQQGKSLYESMKQFSPPFGNYYLNLVKVGEATGDLAKVMTKLSDSLENQYELKRKIRSAMTYPVFILIFSLIMVYLMIAHLLPTFTPIFKDSGLDIAADYPVTQFLINVSDFAAQKFFLPSVIGVLLVFFAAVRISLNYPEGRAHIDNFKFNLPFIGGFVQMQLLAQLCDALGVLLSSGVSLLESLQLAAGSSGSLVVKKALGDAGLSIEKGSSFSSAITKTRVFPQIMTQMISVGEESGDIDEMLFRVSDYYKKELDTTLSSLTSLIEPIMMVLVGVAVFFFVIGLLLPIMGISQAYQQQMH